MGKGASAGHGTAKNRRAKDAARAASMKGEIRPSGRCPVCNHIVQVPMDRHIAAHTHRG